MHRWLQARGGGGTAECESSLGAVRRPGGRWATRALTLAYPTGLLRHRKGPPNSEALSIKTPRMTPLASPARPTPAWDSRSRVSPLA